MRKLFPKRSGFLFRNQASILFVSLWTLVILSIMAIGISSRVSAEINLVKFLNNNLISLYLAKAAVARVKVEFENDKTPNYDTLYELGKARNYDLEDATVKLNLIDEASFIDINNAPVDILANLPGIDLDLATQISQFTLKPFKIKEELLLVEGISEEIFLKIKDLITTHSQGRVNINTASAAVLEILGLDSQFIDIILSYRKGNDYEEATEDDNVFESVATIIDNLKLYGLITVAHEEQIARLKEQNLLCVEAKNLRLEVETEFVGRPVKDYVIVFDRGTNKIKFWQEK
ncbi:MAG: hypothetical protein DRP74_06370 [Candidatus Omnitrophota bacterium]|nr:MAG: hypothetical protein DRP74_06370 [Candidatus Omnitrophota bacterium]